MAPTCVTTTLANSMWLGVAALVVAVISVTLLQELPLRHELGETEAIGQGLAPQAELPVGRTILVEKT